MAGPERSFGGITGATAVAAASDACDPGAFDVTVAFDRVSAFATTGTAWPESDVEYVIYETRGVGIAGPRERDRTRLESSGSTADVAAQRTFRLSSHDASGPLCFNVQAIDPLGRVATNASESCVDPAQGNYFRGCEARPRRAAGCAWPSLLGMWALSLRRRRPVREAA